MDKKISLPLAIVLAAIVFSIGYYAVQNNKQKSIERQQALELEQKKAAEEAKALMARKEYAAGRKNDCLKIYETEGKKWNNVRGWRYVEDDDQCYIRYKEPEPKTKTECDEMYPVTGDNSLVWIRQNFLCKEGEFENVF